VFYEAIGDRSVVRAVQFANWRGHLSCGRWPATGRGVHGEDDQAGRGRGGSR
jgi:hypothetical protein